MGGSLLQCTLASFNQKGGNWNSKSPTPLLPRFHTKVKTLVPLGYLAFIQCITKILESSKSYTCKTYVGNISAYPCQTSIIVLRWVSSSNTLYKSEHIPAALGFLP
jgi:hypothetical protein